jgi:hypothetical protein
VGVISDAVFVQKRENVVKWVVVFIGILMGSQVQILPQTGYPNGVFIALVRPFMNIPGQSLNWQWHPFSSWLFTGHTVFDFIYSELLKMLNQPRIKESGVYLYDACILNFFELSIMC